MVGVWAALPVAPLPLAAYSEDLPLNISIGGGWTLVNVVNEKISGEEVPGLRGNARSPGGSEAARPGTKQMVW